jgi:16S rRNA (guanine527-N7)-methyltransferase
VSTLLEILEDAIARLPAADPAPDVAERLLLYVTELPRYNQRYRIVGARTPELIAADLVTDAVGLLPLVSGPLADVGSGAGLPGVVLKLLDPRLPVTLIEPRQKPAAFLSWICGTLGLTDVRVVDGRAEELQPRDLWSGLAATCIVSKGFGPLEKLVHAAAHLAAPGAMLLVPSSEPECRLPGARVAGHPLMPSRYIHSKRLETLDP